MTDIEQRAQDALNEVADHRVRRLRWGDERRDHDTIEAMCRQIEAHDATKAEFEAFRRDVSEAVKAAIDGCGHDGMKCCYIRSHFSRFILPQPVDPLVEAMREACDAQGLATLHTPKELTVHLRAALAKRGLTIQEQNP